MALRSGWCAATLVVAFAAADSTIADEAPPAPRASPAMAQPAELPDVPELARVRQLYGEAKEAEALAAAREILAQVEAERGAAPFEASCVLSLLAEILRRPTPRAGMTRA